MNADNWFLNLVHFETWSSVGSVRLSAHAEVLPATTRREQDAPTTFKTMVLKIDVVYLRLSACIGG
jgi:hypothetical protein